MNTHSEYCFQKHGTLSFIYYQLPTLSVSLQFLLSVDQIKPDFQHFSSRCKNECPKKNLLHPLYVLGNAKMYSQQNIRSAPKNKFSYLSLCKTRIKIIIIVKSSVF